ncbi:MAG: TonB-dependent receptor [Gammaproteobacteria bacterium]|nr:TonB-dependent receptor [Gammaproteobacteria bacterium]
MQSPIAQAQEDVLIEEIIVTATRRNQTVQEIPYNINVITANQLAQTGISDPASLVRLVPGLNIVDEGPRVSGNRNTYNIRGMNVDAANNNDDNAPISQATVSTYLGEIPVFFPMKLVDLERVEVLRGPQGTLYGAGSVGGTIRFIPKKPSTDGTTLDATAELSATDGAGNSSYDIALTANFPTSDKTAFRATVGHEYLSGFIDAIGLIEDTGTPKNPGEIVLADPLDILGSGTVQAPIIEDSNDSDHTYIRASFLMVPNEEVEIGLNYNYQTIEANNRYEDNRFFGSGEEYVTHKAYTDPQDAEITMLDLDVQADLGFARLTSSTGYSDVSTRSISDSSGFLRTNIPQYYFGNPRVFSPIVRTQDVQTFTQELRLVSQGDGPIDWVVGAFYTKKDLDFNLDQRLSGANEYTNLYFGTPAPLDFTDVLVDGGTFQEFTELAGFGEIIWHVNDEWQITGGVRVFRDELTGTSGLPLPYASRTLEYYYYGTATDDFLLGGFNPTNFDGSESIFKINTSYDMSEDSMIFMTYAEGFRVGGANQLPETDPLGNDNTDILTYDPDDVENFEFGIKGTIDGRFNYTATAFLVDWTNFQATLQGAFGIAFVDNVPSAESRGFELELNGYVTENFDFNLGYSYVDATVSQAFLFSKDDPSTEIPKGNRLPGAAEHEYSAAANFRVPLASSELVFHINSSYKSEVLSNYRDLPSVESISFAEFDSFSLWGASVTWSKNNYNITAFGDNLSNQRGESSVITASFYGDRDQGWGVIRPRTYGIRFKYSYK